MEIVEQEVERVLPGWWLVPRFPIGQNNFSISRSDSLWALEGGRSENASSRPKKGRSKIGKTWSPEGRFYKFCCSWFDYVETSSKTKKVHQLHPQDGRNRICLFTGRIHKNILINFGGICRILGSSTYPEVCALVADRPLWGPYLSVW